MPMLGSILKFSTIVRGDRVSGSPFGFSVQVTPMPTLSIFYGIVIQMFLAGSWAAALSRGLWRATKR